MPDWAPDALHMVYAKPTTPMLFPVPVPGVESAELEVMRVERHKLGGATTLVAFAGQNNYYPAYSPDGQWVAFNRSPSNAESFDNAAPDPDAGTMPDGELWAVSANGGSAIRMSNASDPGLLSWPKWAPVLNDYYGGKIMWLTFSSARAYGLRSNAWQQTQLWMVAFDPAKAAAGQDRELPGVLVAVPGHSQRQPHRPVGHGRAAARVLHLRPMRHERGLRVGQLRPFLSPPALLPRARSLHGAPQADAVRTMLHTSAEPGCMAQEHPWQLEDW